MVGIDPKENKDNAFFFWGGGVGKGEGGRGRGVFSITKYI